MYHDLDDIAHEAYPYLYPIVLMEATRKQMWAKRPQQTGDPHGLFSHQMNSITDKWRTVARSNIDSLFSSAWVDLSAGPVLLTIPPADARYHMFQMIDFWTDVFAVAGSRSNGQNGKKICIIGPSDSGTLTSPSKEADFVLRCPTPTMWILGRTAVQSDSDLSRAREFISQCTLVPLASPGFTDEVETISVPAQGVSPVKFVDNLTAAEFFESADAILRREGPHLTDGSVVMRLASLGIGTGSPFVFAETSSVIRDSLNRAIDNHRAESDFIHFSDDSRVNGWSYTSANIGTWGNNYSRRAFVARIGLAANPAEDAVYLHSLLDDHGNSLDGARTYVIHFETPPPVHAFWSVTAYDQEGFLFENELNRFGLRSRDQFQTNTNGSFEIYFAPECPSPEVTDNWVPTQPGELSLLMRLYMPRSEFLTGKWSPPEIRILS